MASSFQILMPEWRCLLKLKGVSFEKVVFVMGCFGHRYGQWLHVETTNAKND
jgi:hypothetical protein